MIISVTERGTFRRCKQQWDYSSFNRQGLTSFVPPTALSFGSLIHKCHEKWTLNQGTPVQDVVLGVVAEGLRELKERYKKQIGVEPDDVELKGFFEQGQLALEMMINYESKWGWNIPEGYTFLKPEQTIIVPIPGTEHECTNNTLGVDYEDCTECDDDGVAWHYLEGTLDVLLRDAGGRLWIGERKTYGNRPNVNVLQTNDQFLSYIWLLTQLNMGEVGGLYYDGMWKRSWDKNRTLDDLFLREPLIRGPEEVINIGVQIRDEALDMAQSDLRIYRNRPAIGGCWDCQFDRLCTAEFRDEDPAYVRARHYVTREKHDWQKDAAD